MLHKIQKILIDNSSAIMVSLLVFFGFIIKILNIYDFSVYGDESFSIFHAQKPISELIQVLLTDRNPPLYFILLHYWIKCTSIAVLHVKTLSSIFSILTSIVLYFFAKKHFNLLSAVFISFSFFLSDVHFDQSHEVRSFSLVILLVSISSFVFFELVQKRSILMLILLSFVNLALLFTHYISFFFIVAQMLSSLLFIREDKKLWKTLLVSYGLTALFYLPYVKVVLDNIPEDKTFWLQKPVLADLWYVFEKLAEDYDLERIYWMILASSVVFLFLNKTWRVFENLELKKYVYLLIWFLFPVLACYGVAQFTPIFRLKYVLFSSPAWMLLTGYILSCIRIPSWTRWLLVMPFLYWNLKHFHPVDRGIENWKQTAEIVKSLKKERTITVIAAGYKHIDFCYYYNPGFFKDYAHTVDLLKQDDIIEGYDSYHVEHIDWSKYDYAIIVQSHHLVVDPNNTIEKYMDAHFNLCKRYGDSNSAIVSLYSKKELVCENLVLMESIPADSASCTLWDYERWADDMGAREIIKYSSGMENQDTCAKNWNLSKDQAFNSKFSNSINSKYQFGLTLIQNTVNLAEISARVQIYPTTLCKALFVISLEDNGKPIFRSETNLAEKATQLNQWNSVQVTLPIPMDKWGNYELRAYIWNENNCDIWADDYSYSLTYMKKVIK